MNQAEPTPDSISAAIEAVLRTLSNQETAGSSRLLLAVSGGLDSMVLLHETHRYASRNPASLIVGHVNHGLRDNNSDADEELVRRECQRLGLPLKCIRLTPKTLEKQSRGSLEEAARTFRYEWLGSTASSHQAVAVLTAHHQNDVIETVIHNLIRGSGPRGLAGIPVVRPLRDNIQLARPLLSISKQQLQEHANRYSIPFRFDESNQDPRFTRNRIRQFLNSLAPEDFKDLPSEFLSLSNACNQLTRQLDDISRQMLDQAIVTRQPDHVLFRNEPFRERSLYLIGHAFNQFWIWQEWPRKKMTRQHWKSLSQFLQKPDHGRMELPGHIIATREHQWTRIRRLPASDRPPPQTPPADP